MSRCEFCGTSEEDHSPKCPNKPTDPTMVALRDFLERIDQACDLEEARQLAAQAMKILDDPAS